MQAYAPHFPHAKTERWYLLLADPVNNYTWTWTVTDLLEAEALGAKHMARLLEGRPKANGIKVWGLYTCSVLHNFTTDVDRDGTVDGGGAQGEAHGMAAGGQAQG